MTILTRSHLLRLSQVADSVFLRRLISRAPRAQRSATINGRFLKYVTTCYSSPSDVGEDGNADSISVSTPQKAMENTGNPWLGTFLDQVREAGTPAPKRRFRDSDDEVDLVECAKRPRLENIHAGIQGHVEHNSAHETNRISGYYANANMPQTTGTPPTHISDRPPSYSRPSADSRTLNPTSSSDTVRQPTLDNRTHGAYISPYKNNPDLARALAHSQHITNSLAKVHSSLSNPGIPTTQQTHEERTSSYGPRTPAGPAQRQMHQVAGQGHVRNALPVSNRYVETSKHHEQRDSGSTNAPPSDNSVPSPSPYQQNSGPQTNTSSHAHGLEKLSTHSKSSQGAYNSAPPALRVPTYYEHTGGTHINLLPSKSGVYANQDFKTGKFIDGHGAIFSNDRSGPYRYLKPDNRGQELAIMEATYVTISDFELYMGCSPSCFIDTMESYDKQYQQIQKHLEEVWIGSPESVPKLRVVEGWNTCHIDHATPAPLVADTIPPWFIRCQPGVTTSQPCCIEHEKETWTKMGCVRSLADRLWQDWGNEYFSGVEAKK